MNCFPPARRFQERRLVIVPWWQGLGIGPKLSESLGAHLIAGGATGGKEARYNSVTANAGLGAQLSQPGSKWRANANNGKLSHGGAYGSKDKPRYIQYSHEFVGHGGVRAAGAASASAPASASGGGARGGAAPYGGRTPAPAASRLPGSPGAGGARGDPG